ncbi:MAG: transcription antitermination factor NusB [Phycisphaerales bacterium]
MSKPRDIRRLAFLALYQLDAQSEVDEGEVRTALEQSAADLSTEFREQDIEKAMAMAMGAFEGRRSSDATVRDLAPSWPSHRQPAVDRAILRLAIHEIRGGATPPKVAIAEAVRLAKAYSTERSPAFVNGVLDKIYKALPAAHSTEEEG